MTQQILFRDHEIFHLAVLLGMSLHWIFIRRIASGNIPNLRTSLISAELLSASAS
jgi:hypothetical protein